MTEFSRAQLLAGGLRGGVTLVAGGTVLAAAAPALGGPVEPPEEDLATVRLAASAELLAEAFYNRALNANAFEQEERSYLVAARANEREHYESLAGVLGDGAPLANDFQFTFPANAFKSRAAIAKTGVNLETAFVGAYLGAVASLQTAEYRAVAGQIGASEAMHLSALTELRGGSPVGPAFPAALNIEQATDALAPYLGE